MLVESIIAFGGLIIGLILAHFTKEELPPGRKYFNFLERVLLFVLVILLLYRATSSFVFLIISFVAGFMFFLGISKVYLYLGLALYLAFTFSTTYAYTFVGIIFLLGLTYAALDYTKMEKKKKLVPYIFLNGILFGAPFLLNYASDINKFILDYIFIFFPFLAGATFAKFLLRH